MARISFLLLIILLTGRVNGNSIKQGPDIGSRIVGGESTKIEDYPYQISIAYYDSHYCGGSILGALYVITAAHCTDGYAPNTLFIRAGSSMIDEGGQLVQVDAIFQHPSFDKDTYDYDISVMRLRQSLILGSGVKPISLPSQNEDEVAANIVGTATGWGRIYENGPLPIQLQKVDLPTIAEDVCNLVYGSGVTPRMFCAGYVEGKKDTCQGDSGGPLAAENTLLGITSWGDGCGAQSSPGVYTKVSYFRNYIDGIINS